MRFRVRSKAHFFLPELANIEHKRLKGALLN